MQENSVSNIPYNFDILLPKISAVMWDLDATLIDSEKFYVYALQKYFEKYQVLFDLDSLVGRDLHYAWTLISSYQNEFNDFDTWAGAIVDDVLKCISATDGLPGVRQTLQWFQDHNIAQSVVTNSPGRFAHEAIKLLGFNHFFDHIITRDDVQKGKPDPEPYTCSIALHGVEPQHAMAIEDSVAGSTAALAAKAHVVVLTTQDRALFSKDVIHMNNHENFVRCLDRSPISTLSVLS